MNKSNLARNPRRIAGRTMMERFNNFPGASSIGRHTVATRVTNPVVTRLTFAKDKDTNLEGWFEFDDGLMAMYRNGDAMILFDQYLNKDYEPDTVLCVAAATQGDVDRVMKLLKSIDPSNVEGLLLEFGDE